MDVTKSVLVVDCDPSVPVLVRSCFPRADWNIVCADSLSEVLSSLKERAYDLVLTSPRTNGLRTWSCFARCVLSDLASK
jgi:CheY-like chemotaxis protein